MSDKEFETKIYDFSESLDPLRELMLGNYGETEITQNNYLSWEYLDNPSGKPVAAVAVSSSTNEVVAQYLVIPINILINGVSTGGSLSLNTLTREDFRGKGLFTKLAFKAYEECENRGLKMVYGFPNENSYPGFVRKLEFAHIGDAPIFFKPLRFLSIVRKKIFSSKKSKYGIDLLKDSTLKTSTSQYKIEPLNFDLDKNSYDLFYNEFKNKYPVMIDRTFDHLKWRYIDVPTRSYQIIKITSDNRILGIAVLRAREVYGLNSGFLIDFCVLDKQENAGKILLKQISKYFKQNSIDLIGCMMCKHVKEYSLLRKAGFMTLPKKLLPHNNPVITRVNGNPLETNIDKLENWFLTFGDYDVM